MFFLKIPNAFSTMDWPLLCFLLNKSSRLICYPSSLYKVIMQENNLNIPFVSKDVWWEPILWTSFHVNNPCAFLYKTLPQNPWIIKIAKKAHKNINQSFVAIHNFSSYYTIPTCVPSIAPCTLGNSHHNLNSSINMIIIVLPSKPTNYIFVEMIDIINKFMLNKSHNKISNFK